MFSDKKISIQLVFIILLTSVASIPIKAIIHDRIIGGLIFTALEIFLCSFLLTRICLTNGMFIYNQLDLPVILYFFYGLFLLLWSFIHNNGFYDILQGFRLHFLPVTIYFTIRYYLSYDLSLFSRISRVILIIITIVVVEAYFEMIASKLFGLNIGMWPWIKYIQEARAIPYYIGIAFSRPIGMFAYPHSTGLLSLSGYIMFLLGYRATNRLLYKYLSILCFIGVFIIGSRTAMLGLIIVALYLSSFDKKARKNIMVLSLLTAILLIFLQSVLHSKYTTAHVSNLMAALSPTSEYINLTPFPDGAVLKNIIYWLFGTGFGSTHDLQERYAAYTVFGLEITLLVLYLFQFGLIFIIILTHLFFQIFKLKTLDKNILYYKALLFPFMLSLGHYAEMFTVGVFEVFITIYALAVTYIIHFNVSKTNHSLAAIKLA